MTALGLRQPANFQFVRRRKGAMLGRSWKLNSLSMSAEQLQVHRFGGLGLSEPLLGDEAFFSAAWLCQQALGTGQSPVTVHVVATYGVLTIPRA